MQIVCFFLLEAIFDQSKQLCDRGGTMCELFYVARFWEDKQREDLVAEHLFKEQNIFLSS